MHIDADSNYNWLYAHLRVSIWQRRRQRRRHMRHVHNFTVKCWRGQHRRYTSHQHPTGLSFRACDTFRIRCQAIAATTFDLHTTDYGNLMGPLGNIKWNYCHSPVSCVCVCLSAFNFKYFIEYLLNFLHDKSAQTIAVWLLSISMEILIK